MQREIERKFLVNDQIKECLNEDHVTVLIQQGYLSKHPNRIVRIRYEKFSSEKNGSGIITMMVLMNMNMTSLKMKH